MSKTQIKERIKELAKVFNMEEYLKRRAGKALKGNETEGGVCEGHSA